MDESRFDRLTRLLAGRTTRRTAVGTSLGAFALGALDPVAAGQQATPAPDATPVAEDEVPDFLFVQTAASGRADINPAAGTPNAGETPAPAGGASFLLTLEGHTGQTIYFSDRPDRAVGAIPTERFLKGLGFSADIPPNAALVAEFERGQGVVVLELIEPTWDPDTGTLIYGAEVLEGYEGSTLTPVLADQVAARLPAEFGPSALFIDECWDLTVCWCLAAIYDPYDVENDYDIYLGDIPIGHISTRYSLIWDDCVIQADDYYKGIDSCDSTYWCPSGRTELGRSTGPYEGRVCDGLVEC